MNLKPYEYFCNGSIFINTFLDYDKKPCNGNIRGKILRIDDDGKMYFRSYEQQKIMQKINNCLCENEEKMTPLLSVGFIENNFACIYKADKNNMYRAKLRDLSKVNGDKQFIELIDYGIYYSVDIRTLYLVPHIFLLVTSPLIYACYLKGLEMCNIEEKDIGNLKSIVFDKDVFCTFLSNKTPYVIDLNMNSPNLKGFINLMLRKSSFLK